MSGLLGPVTANPLMLAQALKARQQPRKQLTGQGLLDVAATGLSPVPVIGDAIGLAADASRFYNEPESRTPLNFGLAALGAIPFIPPLGAVAKAMKPEEKMREAFRSLEGVSLGKAYPVTIEHNGVTKNLMARQDKLSNGRSDPALHFVELKKGRMIAGGDEQWLMNSYKLDGKNNLMIEGMPKPVSEEEAQQFLSSFNR